MVRLDPTVPATRERQRLMTRHYLIVLGILSVDDEVKRRRRNLKRSTFWRFPGVVTRANDFTRAMFVLFFFSLPPGAWLQLLCRATGREKHERGKNGEVGYRSQYLPHAKRALYHLSYIPTTPMGTPNCGHIPQPCE
ncbi:UDP-Gal or UDP-GlcNAc-dependent glycosyltransferase [Trypanosoma rangeli]|uniref:UDP-Gal or UDP-GlcNAc-dependent glycosyltransferase n=1 Tax=Trypanosoma rangeli TaxID=5698 RepID=A0A3R7M2B5_TRYRA|nr:UDP-Gal or UDP-GlcNAc-dependent glycosyltransferase [Trypanosoma rangeli]RNE94832.1 UDP-Gal or UDP-GlcNAc-dependent glycosyltransferase [Trypanosoma rangeli]|eukprot:RNE94832.1 UDP-Gal or UDP-GlcNAc-dependent glycosyltransferase [Trypanosoma rangeli]